jgi:hypothetical protein
MKKVKIPESNSQKLDRLLKEHDRLQVEQKRLDRLYKRTIARNKNAH